MFNFPQTKFHSLIFSVEAPRDVIDCAMRMNHRKKQQVHLMRKKMEKKSSWR